MNVTQDKCRRCFTVFETGRMFSNSIISGLLLTTLDDVILSDTNGSKEFHAFCPGRKKLCWKNSKTFCYTDNLYNFRSWDRFLQALNRSHNWFGFCERFILFKHLFRAVCKRIFTSWHFICNLWTLGRKNTTQCSLNRVIISIAFVLSTSRIVTQSPIVPRLPK